MTATAAILIILFVSGPLETVLTQKFDTLEACQDRLNHSDLIDGATGKCIGPDEIWCSPSGRMCVGEHMAALPGA